MRIIKTAILIVSLLTWATEAQAVRVKDLASVKGVRDNQLVGYGLVVGLNGTGDGNKAAFTTQGLANMLKNIGMTVNENDLKVKNVAGVMITANLPPFIKAGQAIDVTLSSLGDASSLQGGTLVATPLKGLDEEVYAIAQGPVRIPEGATVEKEVPVSFGGKNEITLSLNAPDFTTVSRLTAAINASLGGAFAKATDGATVSVAVPDAYRQQEIALLAVLENLDVAPDSIAKVVVDERTGTIVMGENVRINQLALSHGSLTIQVSADQAIAKEMVGKILTDDMVRKMTDDIAGKSGKPKDKLVSLSPGVTLGELALNSVGAAPRDLIAIFQAIKAAGAMQAELTII